MLRSTIVPLVVVLMCACGPSTVQDAEQAKNVSWLADHAKAGDPDALAALCGLAKEGTGGAAAALADARTGVDPTKALESISCMVDLALAGDTAMTAVTHALLKAPAVPVRTSVLNALQAAAADTARRPAVLAYVPDLQQRLRDEEQIVWKRSLFVLNALGPPGQQAMDLALRMPERTRRRELVRDIVDFENIAPQLGPPALQWLGEGEEDVFDHLLRIVTRSGVTIEVAKPVILQMLSSGQEAKVDSAGHLARALSDEGRCDPEVVRGVVLAVSREACEEPCLVQARSVAYKCRRVGDAVLRELANGPAGEDVAGRPREIARATLGLE